MRHLIRFALFALLVGGVLLWVTGVLSFEGGGVHLAGSGGGASETPDPYGKAGRAFAAFEYEAALEFYHRALRTASLDEDKQALARYRIGKCLEEVGRDAEAVEAYRAFIAEHPDHHLVRRAKERAAYLENK